MTEANEDIFAKGLLDLLSPVVLECDERINDVLASQADLSQQIDLLTNGTHLVNCTNTLELQHFMSISTLPTLAPYIQKLSNAKERMDNVNTTLTQINARLDRIQKGGTPQVKK
jgi:hypothetical protein